MFMFCGFGGGFINLVWILGFLIENSGTKEKKNIWGI